MRIEEVCRGNYKNTRLVKNNYFSISGNYHAITAFIELFAFPPS